ncbi:MAG: exosortase Y [Mucilaginibacter sp.]
MKQQNSPFRFAVLFAVLFLVFYYFNILFFRETTPGQNYIPFLAEKLNYIQGLRHILLYCTANLLKLLGYSTIYNNYELLVAGHGSIQVVYSCLGLGLLSFLTAFIIAYPKSLRSKVVAFFVGIIGIEILNIIRFMILALYGNNSTIDHHTIFNIIIYVIVSLGLYFWIKNDLAANNNNHEAN